MKTIIKNLLILIIFLTVHPVLLAQAMEDLDDVSNLQNDFIAVKKANQWAFLNKEGEKVIDYRSDVVLTNKVNSLNQIVSYPVFKEERCLIRKLKGDTYYYGFINKKGVEIIKPQFLNATNFSDGYAIVVLSSKDSIGFNYVLKKAIVSNIIEEYVIDRSGELVKYLYNPRNNAPINYKNGVPIIESKFIAPRVVAVKNQNGKWDIRIF